MWEAAIANLVSRWLDDAMHERRMRKVDLARAAGVDRSVLDRYLKGRSIPNDETIRALAHALQVAPPHPCDLLDELEVEFPTYSKGLVDAARRLHLTMQELLRLADDDRAHLDLIGSRSRGGRARRVFARERLGLSRRETGLELPDD